METINPSPRGRKGANTMDQDKALRIRLVETFNDRAFLKKLGFTRKDIRRVFGAADWKSMLSPQLPIREG